MQLFTLLAAAVSLFHISVLDMANRPMRVGFAPTRIQVRLTFTGELTSGIVCFHVEGPNEHHSCIESEKPFPPVVYRRFDINAAGEYDVYATIGNASTEHVQLKLEGK